MDGSLSPNASPCRQHSQRACQRDAIATLRECSQRKRGAFRCISGRDHGVDGRCPCSGSEREACAEFRTGTLRSGWNLRQCERERRAFALAARHADRAAVLFSHVLDNGESESCSTQCARTSFVDAIEPFEDPL